MATFIRIGVVSLPAGDAYPVAFRPFLFKAVAALATGVADLVSSVGIFPTGVGAFPTDVEAFPTGVGTFPTGIEAFATGVAKEPGDTSGKANDAAANSRLEETVRRCAATSGFRFSLSPSDKKKRITRFVKKHESVQRFT